MGEYFIPKVNEQHRFAVAIPLSGPKMVALLETYATKEELEAGYKQWKAYASKNGGVQPLPLEISNLFQKGGSCKILEELVRETPTDK